VWGLRVYVSVDYELLLSGQAPAQRSRPGCEQLNKRAHLRHGEAQPGRSNERPVFVSASDFIDTGQSVTQTMPSTNLTFRFVAR